MGDPADPGPTTLFRNARDFLVAHREDYDKAHLEFRWPELEAFNWATPAVGGL